MSSGRTRDPQEEQRRQVVFAEAESKYRQLEADPVALAEYLAEINLWDMLASEGLEPEDWSCLDGDRDSKP